MKSIERTQAFDYLCDVTIQRLYVREQWFENSEEEVVEFDRNLEKLGLVSGEDGRLTTCALELDFTRWLAFAGFGDPILRSGDILFYLTSPENKEYEQVTSSDVKVWLRPFARKAFPRFLTSLGSECGNVKRPWISPKLFR